MNEKIVNWMSIEIVKTVRSSYRVAGKEDERGQASNNIRSSTYRRGIRDDEKRVDNSSNSLGAGSTNFPTPQGSSNVYFADNAGIVPAPTPPLSQAHQTNLPRIMSYLFLPPGENNYNLTSREKAFDVVTSPTTQFLAPVKEASPFAASPSTKGGFKDKNSLLSQRFTAIPARNYGEPGLGVADYDSQLGSDCEGNSGGVNAAGSSERINYDPLTGQGFGGANPNLVYDPRYGFIGTNNYPGNNYPVDPNANLNPNYPIAGGSYPNYPSASYPTQPNYPTGGYPNVGYPEYNPANPNYNPGFNPIVPNYNPSYNPPLAGSWNPNSGECCRLPFGRSTSIVSPGFGGSIFTDNNYACRYTIVKSSQDVCRLRLNFRFFNFGGQDPHCSYGYVEIDRKRYCGCRTGQIIQVPFTDFVAKTIAVTYVGYPRNRFNGFYIDVFQESCGQPGSYPSYPFYPSNPQNPSYQYDQISPVYGAPGYIQRRSIASNSTSKVESKEGRVAFPSTGQTHDNNRHKRHLGYSYPKPGLPIPSKDAQIIPSLIGETHEKFFGGTCQSRIFFDYIISSKEALFRNVRCVAGGSTTGYYARSGYLPPKKREIKSSAGEACDVVYEIEGLVTSPSYPNNYPHEVDKCYRFNKAPNFCKLELYVKDFELEESEGCKKDHFSFSTEDKKYCGRSLHDFRKIFDLTLVNSMKIYFVSDAYGTGKGFNIGFAQLPCEASANL